MREKIERKIREKYKELRKINRMAWKIEREKKGRED